MCFCQFFYQIKGTIPDENDLSQTPPKKKRKLAPMKKRKTLQKFREEWLTMNEFKI